MPKLKQAELDERRRDIIVAARRCFLRKGFHQTTTDEICHEAPITAGGLYHYFGSKREVIKAVVQDSADQALENLRSAAETSPNPRSALQRLSMLLLQTIQSSDFRDTARLDLEIWTESTRSEELAHILASGRTAVHQALAGIIQDAIETGEYSNNVDAEGFAELLMSIYTGLQVSKVLGGASMDPQAAMRAFAVLIQGELLTSKSSSGRSTA
jgi:TetR/AcrR family transcriptional regulator, transcriptional repressor of aconitase